MKNFNVNVNAEQVENFKKAAIEARKAAITAAGNSTRSKEIDATRVIGNNGRSVGDMVTLTGVVDMNHEWDINGQKSYSAAVECEDGQWLSVRDVMGLTSAQGYEFDNSKELLNGTKKDHKDDEKVSPTTDLTDAAAYREEIAVTWPTRNELEWCAIMSTTNALKDKTLTYRGTIMRQTIAKRSYQFGDTQVEQGAHRVMTAKVWQIG